MALLAGDDAGHVGEIAPRRLLAENVQAAFEAQDRRLGCCVVGQTDEQCVERPAREAAEVGVMADAVGQSPVAAESDVADGDGLKARMPVDEFPPALADNAVTGDADAKPVAHGATPCGAGVR